MEVTQSLWDHQKEAVEWLKQNGSGILDVDVAGGKTLIALKHVEQTYSKKVLIIKPNKVRSFQRDLQKHTNGNYLFIEENDGSTKQRSREAYIKYQEAIDEPIFVAVNYTAALACEPYRATLKNHMDFDCVIFDEIHRLKNYEGKMAREAYLISKDANFRLGLTGTPLPNGIMDMPKQLQIVRGKPYKTIDWWEDTFCVKDHWGNTQDYKNEDKAHEIFNEHSFSVSNERFDLPDTVDTEYYCSLAPKQQDKHDNAWNKVKTRMFDEDVDEDEISSSIVECHKLATNHKKKYDLLSDVLDDIDGSTVIFFRFHKTIDNAHRKWDNTYELSGRKDERLEWREQSDGHLLTQIQAGAEGIDLTESQYCIFFTPTYSWGNWTQARGRINRPNSQFDTVKFITLIAEDTIEERMMEAIETKSNLVEEVVG